MTPRGKPILRRTCSFPRVGALVVFLAMFTAVSYSASSPATHDNLLRDGSSSPPLISNPQTTSAITSFVDSASEPEPPVAFNSTAVGHAWMTAPAAFVSETIQTFAADCTTPKIEFVFGETVCARVTGAPFGGLQVRRRFSWLTPQGYIVESGSITADPQTHTFTLPQDSTRTIGGETIDHRGTWRVNSTDTSDASVRAAAFFTVRDPDNTAADLSLLKSSISNISGEGNIIHAVRLVNRGPDPAQNVTLTIAVPSNTTFVAGAQESGPTFNCVNPTAGGGGTATCTIANLPNNAEAIFTLVYQIVAGTPASVVISSTATASSNTTELHAPDNSSTVITSATSDVAETSCALSCPGNISVIANVTQNGQSGAIVTFAAAEASGDCGTVSATPVSGSFFPVGTTSVFVAAQGDSCSFNVTVIDSSPVTISCPANVVADAEEGACAAELTPQELGAPTATGNGVTVVGERSDRRELTDPYPGGVTTINWTATDGGGHSATCQQTVTINTDDDAAPTITAPGNVTVDSGTEGAACGRIVGESVLGIPTASDNCSVQITRTGVPSGNFFPVGTTTITYTATDGAGNTATATQQVIVSDDTPPVVTLNGDDPLTPEFDAPTEITVECGTAFTDPGATAEDSCLGALPVTASTIDTNTAGTYTITYTATDGTNVGTATRIVHVVDTAPPTITLNGASTLTVECHDAFSDPGAMANDGCAGSFAAAASTNLDVNTPGTYTISYTATDPSGNAATPVTRTVIVVDTIGPVITPNGASTLTVECHTSFTDPGATAADACSGPAQVTSSGSVDVDVPGSYLISYSATDSSGNTSTVTRTVNVVDTTPPTISCPANVVVTLPLNSSATSMAVPYPAVTATDSCSSANVSSTPASGSVFSVGTTTVNATATDTADNESSCSFTVTVLYNFTGFFSPVGNLPTLNRVNAGRAIPIKFSLSGNKGGNIFAPGYPVSGVIPCNSSDPVVELSETVTAGSSSLSYDPATDQYIYIWKTESSWAGTCRQLVIRLNDGSYHRANFTFR